MTIMGRHILYDYRQYYNLFSRRTTDAGTKTVRNTNVRLLENYPGADGIKTGYTRAAGFNLVASAERSRTDLLSGFPHQRTGTFLEHLLIPLIHFVLLGFCLSPVCAGAAGRPSVRAVAS